MPHLLRRRDLIAGLGVMALRSPAPLFEEIPAAKSGVRWIHDNTFVMRYIPGSSAIAVGPNSPCSDHKVAYGIIKAMTNAIIHVPAGLTTEGLLGRRYIARLIDTVLLVLLIGMVLGLETTLPSTIAGRLGQFFNLVLFLFLWIGYGAALESSRWQATVGKRWMGLRVYNAHASRLALLQAAGRNLAKDGPFLMCQVMPGGQFWALILLGAHLFVMHRSSVHQAIHDRIANTWVASAEATTQLHLT